MVGGGVWMGYNDIPGYVIDADVKLKIIRHYFKF